MKASAPSVRPKMRRTLRALGGRRIVIEGFGRRSPAHVIISGGSDIPVAAWITPNELRRLVEAAKKILR